VGKTAILADRKSASWHVPTKHRSSLDIEIITNGQEAQGVKEANGVPSSSRFAPKSNPFPANLIL
jgi:hypothetical protein